MMPWPRSTEKVTPMLNEPPTCQRCGGEYTMDVGEEATPFCDGCAHIVVEELQAMMARLRAAGNKLCAELVGTQPWLNFDGPHGSDLCLCFPDWDPDVAPLPPKPETHGPLCASFRDAVYAWRALDGKEPE